MVKKIIVDSTLHHQRVALVEDGELIELLIEEKTHQTIVGNIYQGRVMNVLAGMQAAFVDIGQDKNAFLSLTDRKIDGAKKLQQGMQITVQVEKEATGTKGAKLSNELSITGRFVVLLPNQNDYIGISQKITDTKERNRLKKIALKLKPEGYGIILRTNASGKASEEFIDEINSLYLKSQKILETSQYVKAPALVYKDSDSVYRAVRDLFSQDIVEFVINNPSEYEDVKHMAAELSQDFVQKVKLYDKPLPIFEYYSLETQIEKALQKHVWLKSGGFLVIEQTEACVVIDVNTGKFTGKKNLQETIFKTNKEAAVEIAKQLRLRNLSGIIIVDFIDMDSKEYQKHILELLEQETKKDRIRTVVVGMTQLGLVQLTRKKMTEPLSHILLSSCSCCRGSGKTVSMLSTVQKLEQQIVTIFEQTVFNQITLHASQELIDAFSGEDHCYTKAIEAKYNKKIQWIRENSKAKTDYHLDKQKI